MTEQEIRLECLKLAHRNDRLAAQVVEHAKVYEAYAIGPKPETPNKTLTLNKADNPKRAG